MSKVRWVVCAICLLVFAVTLHWLVFQAREIVIQGGVVNGGGQKRAKLSTAELVADD